MGTLRKGADLLSKTESSLRELIQEATTCGDYESVMKLTSWAQSIASLQGVSSPSKIGGSAAQSPSEEGIARTIRTGVLNEKRAKGLSQPPRRRSSRSGYPKFYRQGDILAKVGWSKRSKSEYVHKASRRVVEIVANAISTSSGAADGRLLKAEDFLPGSDPVDGSEIASYKAYLALAWLRQVGLVRQHGRQGYTWTGLEGAQESVDELWKSLPVEGRL